MVVLRLYIFVKNNTEVILGPSLCTSSGNKQFIYSIIGDGKVASIGDGSRGWHVICLVFPLYTYSFFHFQFKYYRVPGWLNE